MARALESARSTGEQINVCAETIRRLAREGRIPMYRVGRYMRFDVDEVRAALRTSTAVGRGVAAAVGPDFDAIDVT
jgi:excisionase family DNA binding protein